MVGWLCRFASFLFFLEAFNIAGTIDNVLIVMSVESVSKALPFTPGAGRSRRCSSRRSPALAGAVLSFSVGQQIAVAAWAVLLGFLSLAVVFRTTDWRQLLREAARRRLRPSRRRGTCRARSPCRSRTLF